MSSSLPSISNPHQLESVRTCEQVTALRRTDIARETAAVGQGSKDVAATTPVLLTEYSACLKTIAAPKLSARLRMPLRGKVFSRLGISSRHELTRRIGQKAVSGATFDPERGERVRISSAADAATPCQDAGTRPV